MKKMIFGLGLLFSGVIGFVGWCIAATQKVQPGARSVILGCLRDLDWLVFWIFVVMAVVGLTISFIEFRKED